MEFWLSGEVQADVYESYRTARKVVETAVNEALGDRNYGPQLLGWDFIAIIREVDHPDYGEVVKYNRREKRLEFRLKLDHARFKTTDDLSRRRMVMEGLLRSVREASAVAPSEAKLDAIERDILDVAHAKRWVVNN